MSTQTSTQGLVAGLFLLSGIVGVVWGAFYIQGASFGQQRTTYTIVMDLDTGSGGLDKDSAVKVGGNRKGRVTEVRVVERSSLESRPNAETLTTLATRRQPDEGLVVTVDIELDADVPMRPGAKVLLDVPLLGSGGSLNIVYTGKPTDDLLAEGSIIVADVAPPPFLRGVDLNDVADAIDEVKAGAQQFNAFMTALAPQEEDDIPPGAWARRIDSIMENTDTLIIDAKDNAWPGWKSEVDQTLANTRSFTERLDGYGESFDNTLQRARDLFDTGKALVDDNRQKIDDSISNVQAFTTRAAGEWSDKFSSALDTGNEAIAGANDLQERLNTSWDSFRPNIDQALARFRLGADQFKLFTVEVRSQPWRLLHRPDTKELESQLLYDASRSYAQAVSDLRAASASLENVLRAQASGADAGGSEVSASEVRALMEELSANRQRQAEAERRLLELMAQFQP